jgi:hypothetical protein
MLAERERACVPRVPALAVVGGGDAGRRPSLSLRRYFTLDVFARNLNRRRRRHGPRCLPLDLTD